MVVLGIASQHDAGAALIADRRILANVKLNQRIQEIDGIHEVFVHPNMGDGGLAVGAAFVEAAKRLDVHPAPVNDVYFGSDLTARDIAKALQSRGYESAPTADVETRIADLQKTLVTTTPELTAAQAKWETTAEAEARQSVSLSPWSVIGPFPAANFEEAHAKSFPPEKEVDLKKAYDGLKWVAAAKFVDGKPHTLAGQNCATYLFRTITTKQPRKLVVSLGSDDSIKLWLNGSVSFEKKILRGVAPDQDKATLELVAGENRLLMKVANGGGGYGFFFQVLPDRCSVAPPSSTVAVPPVSWPA